MGEGDEEREKWMNNEYLSLHQILLLGEGDFSFALSLALSFASATNILATSLDSYDSLIKKYKRAKSNLDSLEKLGASLIHGVDATKMKLHTDLKMRKFDRIVFNFPRAGFHGTEQSLHLINKHKRLVDGFLNNASHMLRSNGEIHVNHKTSGPFCLWNIEKLASQNSLLLISCVPFKIEDYPGYNNKRGDASRCDEPFRLGKCSTFKFILSLGRKKVSTNHSRKTSEKTIPHQEERNPATNHSDSRYKPVTLFSRNVRSPVNERFREDFARIFRWYFTYVEDTFGSREERIGYHVHEAVSRGYERFTNMASGRPSSDFVIYLEELHRLSLKRIEWLKHSLENIRCS
ncbi:heavy metal-associated isoprenylated plant protein 41-like [Chenopodium quinoa]|uniref:heavy metal-associated isoprenylated plant protein 41-like n=1 Tax=Chenopodium quinoa TaxID=63459 RepID=UPI000B77A2BA|nr:heavy metal-associated isoprenylated plant protein 41-like [Chenopodium quinoa]